MRAPLYTWFSIGLMVFASTAGDCLMSRAMKHMGSPIELWRKAGVWTVMRRMASSAEIWIEVAFMAVACFSLLFGLAWADVNRVAMVAGQAVAVQSPARKRRGDVVTLPGRCLSTPGCAEYVAWTSLITVAFRSWASRTPGKNSASSDNASWMISWRPRSTIVFDELTTSSK